MLLLRSSSRLLARGSRHHAASSAFSSSSSFSHSPPRASRRHPSVSVSAVASPSSRKDECARDERGGGKKRATSASSPSPASSVLSKSAATDKNSKIVPSALVRGGDGDRIPSTSSVEGAADVLVVALPQGSDPSAAAAEVLGGVSGSSSSSSSVEKVGGGAGGAESAASDNNKKSSNFAARAWAAYDAALTEHPVAVKSATSFVGFLLGDLIAQSIVGLPYDARRTLRLVAFGVFMDGPIGHLWYTTLDRKVFPKEPTSTRAVVAKTALDQLLWAPAFSCVFFAFVNLFEGRPDLIVPAIAAKLLPMLAANYALWPLAHLINFKFVPSKQRILYINCVQILWSAYLSHLSAGAIRAAGHF